MKKLCFLLVTLLLSISALYGQNFAKMVQQGAKAEGVKKYTEAVAWYRKAAEKGYAPAQKKLGLCYEEGRGVPQDFALAAVWYTKAAEGGNADDQYNLGSRYQSGKGVPQDSVQAITWFRKAAERGHARAQSDLAYCYDTGKGVAQDYAQAVVWYTKAAEQGDVRSQSNLGNCYYHGWGVPVDYAQAVAWFRKAAEKGDAKAKNGLGVCYRYGQGVSQNDTQAVAWYTSAAEQGYAIAQYNLGVCYYYERGVSQNYSAAAEWYRRAAEQGYAPAQRLLGVCYEDGKGVLKDDKQAVAWYRKAAEQGNLNAQSLLGGAYANGKGVSRDYAQAAIWYRKAAEQGDKNAQYTLGDYYEYGKGVTQDYAQAVYWYRKVAKQDNQSAQEKLGHFYEDGKGVLQNYALAVVWYSKASKSYFFTSKYSLERILKSPEYLAQIKNIQNSPFSAYAKQYVEPRINEWQKKGEFEKTSDWQARVNALTRNEKIAELTRFAEQEYIEICELAGKPTYTLGDYDADNEVFLVTWENKDMLVPVPLAEAQAFKMGWESGERVPSYFVENDKIVLAEVLFTLPDKKQYKYSNQASLNYAVADVSYNFDPFEIDVDGGATSGSQTISQTKVTVGKSDVDINIPQSETVNDKTFAVIVANENYRRESEVAYALNDGEVFRSYCTKTLGLPEKNIRYFADATLNDIRAGMNWLGQIANAYAGQAKILFYYAGHGIPDQKDLSSYLLPTDGYGSDVETGYKISDLYAKLSALPTQSVVVFLDACFSGAQRGGEMLASTRGVAIKAKADAPAGRMVVFSAVQGDETAYPYCEKGHGMFTYFLLKKLQATQGNATLGELGDYIVEHVSQKSTVENPKGQTPVVTPAGAFLDGWKTLKLR